MDMLTNDLQRYVENMTKLVSKELDSFQQLEALEAWKGKLKRSISTLGSEVEGLMGCFGFFMRGAIAVKEKKSNVLQGLLLAHDLEDLQQMAKEKLAGAEKDVILAGRASRTKQILEEIVEQNTSNIIFFVVLC